MSLAPRASLEVRTPFELAVLLDAEVSESLPERVLWLEQLVAWVRGRDQFQPPGPRAAESSTERLEMLLQLLEAYPHWREKVRATVSSLLASTSALALLVDVGADRDRGLWTAVAGRLSLRVFPHASSDEDLRPIVRRLFTGEVAARWLELLPEALVSRCQALLDPDGVTFQPVRVAGREAVALLGAQASALGLSLTRAQGGGLRESPYWSLPAACEALLAAGSPVELDRAGARLAETVRRCLDRLETSRARLEEGPVETHLVLRVHVVRDALVRIGELGARRAGANTQLLASLVRAQLRYQQMGALWSKAWRPLSRRIMEHTGSVGEHYITRNSAQWHQMVAAGAGGGALTVLTAALKLVISAAGLSLFFTGLAASANYALSFLVLQLFGFALATKQPSMTAAALAAAVDVRTRDGSLHKLSREVAVVVRSQAASVLGNLGVVVPGAVLVQWVSMKAGAPVVDLEQARYVIASIDPLNGAVLPFALLTGVLLWLSSVGGGWVENWARCRRVPQALARHRGLLSLLGRARTGRFAAWIDHHLCGIGSNLTLGLLLGMVPAVSQFFGLGLDVRHVTLSAGSLGFAGAALGAEGVLQPEFVRAVLGIGVIAVANLGVSFGLGLVMALRARGLRPRPLPLLRAVWDGLVMGIRNRAPAYVRLLRPVAAAAAPRAHSPHLAGGLTRPGQDPAAVA